MTILLSLAVAIAGAMVYFASANPKVMELGRLSFFAGLLAFLIRFGAEALSAFNG
jgi:Na+/phosphate symporter